MANPVELLKREKHGFDVWPEVLHHARVKSPMKEIAAGDLERMKWYGIFYRKRDVPGTYMLRVRITANELTSAQAKEIARVAYDLGYGIVDLTTRANIQLQGLTIDAVPRALQRLEAVGLTCKQTGLDNVRNVFGHPLSGVDPEELYDTRELCETITRLFLDHRDYANLPRKFNIALCGAAQQGIHYWTQDLSFLATQQEGRIGFRLLVGGKQGQSPQLGRLLPICVPPELVAPITGAALELFREQGSREKRDSARFHFLLERIGIDGVLHEIERRLGVALERAKPDEDPFPPSGHDDLVGWYPQRQHDRWALGLCPALGRMSWMQLEGAGLAAERWGSGRLRTTPEQGLMILDVRSAFRSAIATQLAERNLSVHVDSRVRHVVACTGKQFCNIAVTETKAHALRLIDELRQRSLELHGIHIHMSGCPSACANHHTADIGLKGVRVKRLLGTREGFDVFLGGGMGGRLHMGKAFRSGVDVEQLPNLVEEVVREYYLRHRPGETFSEYWRRELRSREPSTTREEEYRAPIWECEKCRYQHVGDDPPVYCPRCASLRRCFARLDHDMESQAEPDAGASDPTRALQLTDDGFAVATRVDAVPSDRGLMVRLGPHEIALFRAGDGDIRALDNACPHAGASLADGAVADGCVTCPLHGWQFDLCTGQGVQPTRGAAATFATRIEGGNVLVQVGGRAI